MSEELKKLIKEKGHNLETPEVLAEWIADKMGIWGGCTNQEGYGCEECTCRIGFVMQMKERIKESVRIEKILEATNG